MALGADFNSVEHLQSVLRVWINREVYEYFSDVGDEDWDEDLHTPRASLRVACTHRDSDSIAVTQLRLQLFERIRLQKFQVPYYGIPVGELHETRQFRPQITLYFQEDLNDIEPSYEPVTGEVSFRLMNHTHETITPAIAQTLATKTKTEFYNGGGFVWRKGKNMLSYTDKPRGYSLQIRCRTEQDGKNLISKALDIQNHAPDWSKANFKQNLEPAEAYPTIPPTERVYGELTRLPRRLPVADVRFQYALLHIWGRVHPVTLVDRSTIWPSALAS